MPHGYQWSHEELRNAERAAQIQAQAIVEAQRKERERQEREARRRQVEESLHYKPSTSSSLPRPCPAPQSPYDRMRNKERSAERVHTSVAKMRARKAMAANFGSADYIHNRYGHAVWLGKVTEYRNKFGCSEEDAITLMVRDYKESEWAHLEDPLIEQFMGHRE